MQPCTHQRAELQADGGDHQDQRIAHDMPSHDATLAHALATGGAHEIGVEDVENGGTRRARQKRQRADAERNRRQDEVGEPAVAIAEARQPFELQGEEVHQQQAEPELG